jgi:hypothetical protein
MGLSHGRRAAVRPAGSLATTRLKALTAGRLHWVVCDGEQFGRLIHFQLTTKHEDALPFQSTSMMRLRSTYIDAGSRTGRSASSSLYLYLISPRSCRASGSGEPMKDAMLVMFSFGQCDTPGQLDGTNKRDGD